MGTEGKEVIAEIPLLIFRDGHLRNLKLADVRQAFCQALNLSLKLTSLVKKFNLTSLVEKLNKHELLALRVPDRSSKLTDPLFD